MVHASRLKPHFYAKTTDRPSDMLLSSLASWRQITSFPWKKSLLSVDIMAQSSLHVCNLIYVDQHG